MNDERDWADQPYVKVYRSVIRDMTPIYADKALFGSWVSLLMEADASYPAPASLPRWLADDVLAELVEHGAIVTVPPDHYTLTGLAKERIAQQMGRRAGGLARANGAERDPKTGHFLASNDQQTQQRDAGDAGEMLDQQAAHVAGDQHHQLPSPTEPNRTDTNPAEPPRDPANDYWSVTGRYPSDAVLRWLDDLTAEYGADAVIEHLGARSEEDRSVKTLLGRVGDSLKAQARALDRKERAVVERVVQANQKTRAASQIVISRHNAGEHEASPVEACPSCQRTAA